MYGQACKYMKTLVKKTLAKSALSNGDESWTVDKGRLASAESRFKISTAR